MRLGEAQMLTVGGLNRAVRLQLEHSWGDLRIVGEVGDLSRAASGHLYFTLNDETEAAQLRIVMFKGDARKTRAPIENGARLCLRGSLTLFEARGTFQFVARTALPAGEGGLNAEFKRLLAKLTAEGLLDPARKRPLPLLPRCIGLVTSEHGAALHDVLRVAEGRCPVRIVLAPCLVQGVEAPRSILSALRGIQNVPELDLVIVARGGGGAEDLWAFNDEAVVRAIAACRVPVVTGIGHETDTTLADWVADVRAATPSNAAEISVPEHAVLSEQLEGQLRRLSRGLENKIARERLRLSRAAQKLRHPRSALGVSHQRLDELEARLARSMKQRLGSVGLLLKAKNRRLVARDPRARLASQRALFERARTRLELLAPRLFAGARLRLQHAELGLGQAMTSQRLRERHAFASLVGRMQALSPLNVLARGYAIAFSERTGRALRSASEVSSGERVRLRLHAGEITAQVLETNPVPESLPKVAP